MRWTGSIDLQPEVVDGSAIASWRSNSLVAEGMTVDEVAAIIDHRLPGTASAR